jgi:hypothetical protein
VNAEPRERIHPEAVLVCALLFGLSTHCSEKRIEVNGTAVQNLESRTAETSAFPGVRLYAQASEQAVEREPNGTRAEADVIANNPMGLSITGDMRISGAIGALGDVDVYRLTVAEPSVFRFETFDATGVSCQGISTSLRILNADLYSDQFSGIGSCSALVVRLAAGTYYLEVSESGNDDLISGYVLEANLAHNVGSEAEMAEGSNDSLASAESLPGSDVYVTGSVPGGLELGSDYYSIHVPDGDSLRAEIIEPGLVDSGYPYVGQNNYSPRSCESQRARGVLLLYDCSGNELAFDDYGGRGRCAKIDGTGGPHLKHAGARNLAGGTYFLRVTGVAAVQYTLHVTIRQGGSAGSSCTGLSDGTPCDRTGHCCGGICVSNYDPQHCGSSCTPCPSGWGWYGTCDGTTCGFKCIPDFYSFDHHDAFRDCDGLASNGCEADLNSVGTCGRCNCRCTGQAFCDNFTCEPYGNGCP